ncbi:D-serine ammonia-lyase [Alkalicoccus saliphilus]|uniref:Probable D-serine dehydratase n=1 Tax=Alkalicoccus saliphilus TaxID=200989 RepID=A0A2T4U9Q8_9BACI|nr:D-serine ammonia-lyase [Alkalicoccus saliphilus]PTL40133.1 D-serine ammonia-lyase [Alkalicoccus saliphilus]
MHEDKIKWWELKYPEFKALKKMDPLIWLNPQHRSSIEEGDNLPVNLEDMKEAEALWHRFAPYLEKEFPQTKDNRGIVESRICRISTMKNQLNKYYESELKGSLWMKCDNELPIAGSVKARGGVYEVLSHAEQLALKHEKIKEEESREAFASEDMKKFLSMFTIGVGSTGNLGLSIGIISARLGFKVHVYMSGDAKAWKKELLRSEGAFVHESEGDFSLAVDEGREQTINKPDGYFVDDEKSRHLFLGYSTAAFRLNEQLQKENIIIDEKHPLVVYIPCGVGGAPGGLTFGLKQVFGSAVHCFFIEPTHAPAMLLGLMTGEKDKISVQDIGIDNVTEADGLAVGRPSSFASEICEQLLCGEFTTGDEDLFRMLSLLYEAEGIFVEPSAAAGFAGPARINTSGYNIDNENTTHLVWATGGMIVPAEERTFYIDKGKETVRRRSQ